MVAIRDERQRRRFSLRLRLRSGRPHPSRADTRTSFPGVHECRPPLSRMFATEPMPTAIDVSPRGAPRTGRGGGELCTRLRHTGGGGPATVPSGGRSGGAVAVSARASFCGRSSAARSPERSQYRRRAARCAQHAANQILQASLWNETVPPSAVSHQYSLDVSAGEPVDTRAVVARQPTPSDYNAKGYRSCGSGVALSPKGPKPRRRSAGKSTMFERRFSILTNPRRLPTTRARQS